MTRLAEALRDRRRTLGLTLGSLAETASCSKAYLSAIENQRLDNPPSQLVLERLEEALRLKRGELQALANWQRTPGPVKADVQRLAQSHRKMLHVLQRSMRSASGEAVDLDALYRNGELNRLIEQAQGNIEAMRPLAVQVPLINKVAAGYPTDFTDLEYPARVADEYLTCPDVTDADAFAARVVGDSMLPDYREGDVIVFSPQRAPAEGSDCFVRLMPDHHTTFKRVFFEDDQRVRLQPLNPSFSAQTVAMRQVSGMYPAVYRIQKLG